MRALALAVALGAVALHPAAAPAADGRALYDEHCASCHLEGGVGNPGMAPSLRGDLWQRLGERGPAYLSAVIVNGLAGVSLDGMTYSGAMRPVGDEMTAKDIAAVANYVLRSLNGVRKPVAPRQVEDYMKNPMDRAALLALRSGTDR